MENEKFFGVNETNITTPLSQPPLSFFKSSQRPSDLLLPSNNCFLNLNWENSMDHQQSAQFESALSSMVSSPTNIASSSSPSQLPSREDSFVIRELIGRLGSICNSGSGRGDICSGGTFSSNTSCYTTPLDSPPKLNLSMMDQQHGNLPHFPSLVPLPTPDPGFAERAARFSCFTGQFGPEMSYRSTTNTPRVDNGRLSRVSSNKDFGLEMEMRSGFNAVSRSTTPDNAGLRDESSALSEQIPVDDEANLKGPRKRKAASKAKSKTSAIDDANNSNAKRSKAGEAVEANGTNSINTEGKETKNTEKVVPEPLKDYIHVRARRGQATDSHSLAERVRREKISERMKFLQDLVPGCNKVTGKAVMLDEIINYVQSLQRQVEFLSMKLATVNPRLDFNMEALLSKDIRGSMPQLSGVYPLDSSAASGGAFTYVHDSSPQQGPPQLQNEAAQYFVNSSDPGLRLFPLDGFGEAASQFAAFWGDDLESVVQMGFSQNQSGISIDGSLPSAHMKVEL
ncbi:hypothetical protein GIB67_034965 [Kingdonia uniflora]|uniref:BHLH domain-containing protein n=1 Tax=Kingdonia uniflora TaxID=39325 RepID=A0A7J7NHC5_9MAGN|nr:hypothetical protein GIB67_034965 [Kingdonia uniflora]